MAKKSFAVIGLGQFGRTIVEELVENGMDVIAIDNDEEAVQKDHKHQTQGFSVWRRRRRQSVLLRLPVL